MHRFYRTVAIETAQNGVSHRILLDGKRAKTPGRCDLLVPTEALARKLAVEWQNQGDRIHPSTMPLTSIANTALDRVAANRDSVLDGLLSYAENEPLCYRVAEPLELASRQKAGWQPLLDWAAETHNAWLKITTSITAIKQPSESLAGLRSAAAGYDDMILAALGVVVSATGSLLLGLALAANRLNGEEVFSLSCLEETYQIERWGIDAEAEVRRAAIAEDIKQSARFMMLCRLSKIG